MFDLDVVKTGRASRNVSSSPEGAGRPGEALRWRRPAPAGSGEAGGDRAGVPTPPSVHRAAGRGGRARQERRADQDGEANEASEREDACTLRISGIEHVGAGSARRLRFQTTAARPSPSPTAAEDDHADPELVGVGFSRGALGAGSRPRARGRPVVGVPAFRAAAKEGLGSASSTPGPDPGARATERVPVECGECSWATCSCGAVVWTTTGVATGVTGIGSVTGGRRWGRVVAGGAVGRVVVGGGVSGGSVVGGGVSGRVGGRGVGGRGVGDRRVERVAGCRRDDGAGPGGPDGHDGRGARGAPCAVDADAGTTGAQRQPARSTRPARSSARERGSIRSLAVAGGRALPGRLLAAARGVPDVGRGGCRGEPPVAEVAHDLETRWRPRGS